MASQGSPLWQWPMASRAKALKRTSHEVSLEQTGETWNYAPIYTISDVRGLFPYEMWEWDSNITYGNVIPILYMGMSFQLQIPISYMGILFPHEIGEWPTIINFAPWMHCRSHI